MRYFLLVTVEYRMCGRMTCVMPQSLGRALSSRKSPFRKAFSQIENNLIYNQLISFYRQNATYWSRRFNTESL